MQPLHANDHPLQGTPTLRDNPRSPMGEPFAEDPLDQLVNRHEPQSLTERRAVHPDPYAAWLKEREVERRLATATAMPGRAGRLRGSRPHKAPWETIMVTLSPDLR
jgi:hypothetical protein